MYAFNKRFRPTTYLGNLTIVTLGCFILGALLGLFGISTIIQANNIWVALMLFLLALASWIFGVVHQKNLKRARISLAIFSGKNDLSRKPMEIAND